jgi:hypothetical protein
MRAGENLRTSCHSYNFLLRHANSSRDNLESSKGKLIGAFVTAAGRKILLLTGRNDPNFVSSSSELIKTHNTNAL